MQWFGGRRIRAEAAPLGGELPPPTPVQVELALLAAQRAAGVPLSRNQAMRLSVVNRARDLVCGVLAMCPFDRRRTRGADVEASLGPGWLDRPDPDHTRGWFVASITDDLFFHGDALARVTVRDPVDDRPVALQWLPWADSTVYRDPYGVVVRAVWTPTATTGEQEPVDVDRSELVHFESPITGVLEAGVDVLSTAARLDGAANRFAGSEVPAGWLQQKPGGTPTTSAAAKELVTAFQAARLVNTIAWLNESVDYHESALDPSRLQLVQGRGYQDAALARLCNVPNFTVGVAVPGDSMTYKSALGARWDLLTFGIAPYIACWEQTLSGEAITPTGTSVVFDLEPFLQTVALGGLAAAEAATVTPAAAPATTPGG